MCILMNDYITHIFIFAFLATRLHKSCTVDKRPSKKSASALFQWSWISETHVVEAPGRRTWRRMETYGNSGYRKIDGTYRICFG